MSNELHYGTCAVWVTGNAADCGCQPTPAWRIRKERGNFPWRVSRWTADATYEELMGCSSFQGALALIEEFNRLKFYGVRGREHVD